MVTSFTFEAIGVVRSPFKERIDAPRQATTAEGRDVTGAIELFEGRRFEDALDGLDAFTHLWVLFVFDRNLGQGAYSPKVLPPRSERKVGVFATRSPHRPNPIGMSVVELVGIEGLVLRVRGLDILDGSPVLDVKPYVAYADAIPDASEGWLVKDPSPPWSIVWTPLARTQVEWVEAQGTSLRREIETRLALGPQPHAYRRIKVENGQARLAWKDWRIFFRVVEGDERTIAIERVQTGYRPSQLASEKTPAIHRSFAETFR